MKAISQSVSLIYEKVTPFEIHNICVVGPMFEEDKGQVLPL